MIDTAERRTFLPNEVVQTYIGRQAAWHSLGNVLGRHATSEELLKAEGFQWDVFKSQLHDGLGRPVDAWGTFRYNRSDKAIGNTAGAIFLAPVGASYGVVPFAEGFKVVDALMATTDGAFYETAGVLGQGHTVWALADLGLAVKVGEDKQTGYVLFSMGYDGKLSVNWRIVLERVVCANTLRIALSEATRASLTIKCTKNAMVRIADTKKAIANLAGDIASVETKLNFLAGRRMNRETMLAVFDRLFPIKANEDGVKASSTRRENVITEILQTYELNDGNAFPEQRGTAYNLLNAITGYVDHSRSNEGKRAESALFGSGDLLKTTAAEVIYELAPNLSTISRGASIPVDWSTSGLNVGVTS